MIEILTGALVVLGGLAAALWRLWQGAGRRAAAAEERAETSERLVEAPRTSERETLDDMKGGQW